MDNARTILLPNEDPKRLAQVQAMAQAQAQFVAMKAASLSGFRLAAELAAWMGWHVCPACEGKRTLDQVLQEFGLATMEFECMECGGLTMVPPVAPGDNPGDHPTAKTEPAVGDGAGI